MIRMSSDWEIGNKTFIACGSAMLALGTRCITTHMKGAYLRSMFQEDLLQNLTESFRVPALHRKVESFGETLIYL